MRRREEGQILVMFAALVIAFIGISALAVDVAMKYSFERKYQATADAASLAGAQELQPTSRSTPVTPAMQQNGRAEALSVAISNLTGATTDPGCAVALAANDVNCLIASGRYRVVIKTPATQCVDCDVNRSIQVTIGEPNFSTNFSRLFGQSTWDLNRTSVAGLSFAKSFAIVTLRPPASGRLPAVTDIALNSNGTIVHVVHGDVATNANMNYNGIGAKLDLETGYRMFYFDPVNPPLWDQLGRGPIGQKLGSMVQDPMYPVPAQPSAAPAPLAAAACQTLVQTSILSNTHYRDAAFEMAVVDAAGNPDWSKVHCLQPGTYNSRYADNNKELTVLLPGLYDFEGGLDIQSVLVGGFDPTQGGVSLMFSEGLAEFKQRGGAVMLNAGTKFRNPAGSEPATAPAMTGGRANLKMTLIVKRDGSPGGNNCPVVLPYPGGCDDNHNGALDLAGGTAIYLAGVQYAPSDNSSIAGSSDGQGYAGQIWAWTLKYTGTTTLNQEGANTEGPGNIRIDTACSPGVSPSCYP